MAYLTISDLESALGSGMVLRLLDDDGDGVADVGALAWVLDQAERVVAGRVSKRYPMTVLLASPGALAQVRGFAVSVAVEFAYRRRPEFFGRDGTPYTAVFNAVMKDLALVEKGEFRLDASGDPIAPTGTTGGIVSLGGAGGGVVAAEYDPTSFTYGFGIF